MKPKIWGSSPLPLTILVFTRTSPAFESPGLDALPAEMTIAWSNHPSL